MSEFERKQTEELINPLWENIKDIIASQKEFSSNDIQYFSDNFYTIFSENEYINLEFAQENGFITGVKSYPEFRSHMIDKFGKDMASSRDTYPNISYKEYMTTYEDKDKSSENQIAVISIEGVIMRGEIEPGIAGADGIAKLIRNAHENKKVKSIVIRVNSPGGGVTASEIIRDEIIAAKSKGKNIVVSMGDVAASGGVWVSTPAEYIFAESTTITGSIGVAVAFPTFENVMDYIGINFDGITTTKNAGWNEFQEMEPEIKDSVMKTSKRVYDRFVEVVAESRNESEEYIKSIAEGRVWIGSKALELNLVDGIGGIEDAISKAADLSNLSEYETIYYRKYLDPQTQLIKDLIEEFDIKIFDQKTVNAFQSINEVLSELDFVKEPTAILTCEVCQIKLY
jgi:protease-4